MISLPLFKNNNNQKFETRLVLLDFLRALAILLVVITHYKYKLLPGGSIGVSIFFCLSGFLITSILLKKNVTVGDFLIRRIFRIYPAYLAICFLHLALMYYVASPDFIKFKQALPSLIFFINMPDEWLGFGVGIFWTLHIEFWFYLLIPIVLRAVRKEQQFQVIFLLIGISFLLKFLKINFNHLIPNYSLFSTLIWMDNLLYGVLTALALQKLQVSNVEKVSANPFQLKLILILIAAFSIILSMAFYLPSIGSVWFFESSIASICTAIIIFIVLQNNLFNYHLPTIITFLATVSYSLYLMHALPLEYPTLFHIHGIYKKLMLCLLIALPLHYLIEKPGMSIGKILSFKFSNKGSKALI